MSSASTPGGLGSVSGSPDVLAALSETFTGLVPNGHTQLREGYAEVGEGVRLHYVEAGNGPMIMLLHGFPEFWFGWRLQIAPLAAAGFRVVAPDTRGYNLSSKPTGIAAYSADRLADDIRGLIRELGAESAFVVGHDWGGTIAWTLAMKSPEVVERLAILDAAHPKSLQKGLPHPRQLSRSWYFFFFALPDVPERVVRRDRYRFFQRFLRDASPPYTPHEMDRYIEAWSQPNAVTAMINYYRCSVRPPKGAKATVSTVSAPTLMIWGADDRYLGPGVREIDRADVPNLDRVEQIPGASHWVHHDAHQRVTQLLIDFFAPASAPAGHPADSLTASADQQS
jgi:epoxide hydrolase 4